MKILVVGDKCSYNLSLLAYFLSEVVNKFEILSVLDFSISPLIMNECIKQKLAFKVITTKKDSKKQFEAILEAEKHYLYVRSVGDNYYDRVSMCYKVAVDICDCVLFLAFSNKSHLMKVAEFAIDQNKIIFSIPGNVSNKFCSGSNFLLKTNNAIFIENASEIANYT